MDEEKLENGDYADMPDTNGDGIPDEFQRVEARIDGHTDKELAFYTSGKCRNGKCYGLLRAERRIVCPECFKQYYGTIFRLLCG